MNVRGKMNVPVHGAKDRITVFLDVDDEDTAEPVCNGAATPAAHSRMDDAFGIVYLIENAQQFWSGACCFHFRTRKSCLLSPVI